jgi:hypothetical protein
VIVFDLPPLEPYTLAEPAPVDLPYAELGLNEDTGDIGNQPTILTGVAAILQRIRVRFRFFLGEWFLDQSLGVPYYRDVLVKNPDQLVISTIFRRILLTTPGVKSVPRFVANLDRETRTLSVDFVAVLDNGSKIVAQAEPFRIG